MAKHNRGISIMTSSIIDVCLVLLAMVVAYFLRFNVLAGIDNVGTLDTHVSWAAIISPVVVFLFGLTSASDYGPSAPDLTRQLGLTIVSTTVSVMMLIVCVFIFRLVDMSRLLLVLFWALMTLFACLKTIAFRYYFKHLYSQGTGQRRVVLVGSGHNAVRYAAGIARQKASPYRIVGNVGPHPISTEVKHLGSYRSIDQVLDSLNPEEIVVALDSHEHGLLDDLLLACEQSGSRVSIMPNYHEFLSTRSNINVEGSTPVININKVPLDNVGFSFIKRMMDILGSLALIVLTSPIMIVAAIGTKLSSPGPIIFAQRRVGRGRQEFDMYKFRSMRVNDEQDSAWTTTDDPRKTRWGAFMRRFSIDELPQLFNVLKGDLSLVGPRPEIPTYVDNFKVSVPLYMIRHQVRPGMTGWAQINGLRGDTSIEKRVTYDLYYINNWTLLFDLKILLLTPAKGVLSNDQESLV